jgi:nucleotide-binding universal stress UspA family protein
VTSSSVLGKPATVIVEEAERRGATLIVVGNRGMQGLGRVPGSVASWVAHHAPCDVYVVKTI